ncbi:MAG TPA: polysaccharide biosynthesis/export family protein [Candidatus Omnitrophota bacterium]|nr:polysaccharide biosynthesis/export family protein [Candidatus Omnitrophota bacterium]HPS19443.1 polysaccharide biosynthesis/export family protein [Candidatus Omnitrophota bacterium]
MMLKKLCFITKAAMFFAIVTACNCVYCDTSGNNSKVKVSDDYQIGPENVLVIDVYYGKDMNLSRKVRVSPSGKMNFPLLGEVEVKGLTVSSLENKLRELLEKDYLVNPQVSVFIEEYSNVSILGQVNKPGVYPLKGKMTVIELISLAGGFTKIAAPNDVKVIRTNDDGSKAAINVKANDIINGGKQEEDVIVKAGDIVTVPESFF